ncbi:MAG: drug/metabolite transporter (DMT)-like permease [Paracoccaceae bacterium]|jgi:drug/metabolite transporter (DMT)-like permease
MNRYSPNTLGAIFMVVSMLGFAMNDASIKSVSVEMGLFQAIFLRGILSSTLVLGLAWQRRALRPTMTRRDPWILLARNGTEICGSYCFLTALFAMPIANATAILQVMPLAVMLAAAVFLNEPLGWRRIVAVLVGFAGMLLIVRPGATGFDRDALWAVASLGFFVVRDLATRSLSRGLDPSFVTLTTSLSMTAMGAVGVAFITPWAPVSGHAALILAGASMLVIIGYFFGVKAMQTGEIVMVSPFRYTILLWSMIAGAVLFDEMPDALSLLGAAIVVGAGLYAFWRERALRLAAERRGQPAPVFGATATAPTGRGGATPPPPEDVTPPQSR